MILSVEDPDQNRYCLFERQLLRTFTGNGKSGI